MNNWNFRTKTDFIFIHCSFTKADQDIGENEIRGWHVEDNSWADIGYNAVIRRAPNYLGGLLEIGRPLDAVGAHVKGFNSRALGICLIGGMSASGGNENNFTASQFHVLRRLLITLKSYAPYAEIKGHGEVEPRKTCPNFDVQEWLVRNSLL